MENMTDDELFAKYQEYGGKFDQSYYNHTHGDMQYDYTVVL